MIQLRFKVGARSTRIIVSFVVVDARWVRFVNKLKTITQTIENKGSIWVVSRLDVPSVET